MSDIKSVIGKHSLHSYVLAVHYIGMLTWILLQQTDFCQYYYEECLFDSIIAVIYCYCFFSVSGGPTRWRLTFYYIIITVESVTLIGVAYPFIDQHNFAIDKVIYVILTSTSFVSGKDYMRRGITKWVKCLDLKIEIDACSYASI